MDIPEFGLESNPLDTKIIAELEKDDESFKEKIPEKIGVLPLQKLVVFPFQIITFLH